ncbi:SAM-dependent MidA family methyltransferase [Krasilnikovia cinnamomea]|uniref:SAM-dependent MidA family methyltransferase n=2 Tax=Krasilnikovia cinnamomea TaxID=349313 RepID=A0A4Q7ZIE8_9ACTN|nr:SAM-dependent MidA family methyltransferase [Krasilnikovia cinnamomea]
MTGRRVGWRTAMQDALYGESGFFTSGAAGPAGHFRTSVHASPLFTSALHHLIGKVDAALRHPPRFDVVDVGAGRGELLTALHPLLAESLGSRARLTGVEAAPRPPGLDASIGWRRDVPDGIVGVLLGTEWLDNVPLDVAEADRDGRVRRVLVEPYTGAESLGGPVDAADAFWLARWWPVRSPGERAEIGWPRDVAWADAVSAVRRGCALAVDYGHVRDDRPVLGTLTGFRAGRQVPPVPDGGCDVTAHVAVDAAATATGSPYVLLRQRAALHALGVSAARPPLDQAGTDPAGYLRALSRAGAAAELTDAAGLGGHWWLLHGIGMDPPLPQR